MILLFSGGLDSFIAYHYLGKPATVYFDLNTPYTTKEIKVVQKLIPNTVVEKVIDFSTRQIGKNAYVPYRNLHLALLANKYSNLIVMAGLADDKVNDKNEKVFRQFSYLMSDMMEKTITVMSPFWKMTKEQVVGWYLNIYQGDPKDLLNTISCYSPTKKTYCGSCPACFRRWCALRANGIDVLPFHNLELLQEYLQKAKEGRHYISERNATIIKEVERYLS